MSAVPLRRPVAVPRSVSARRASASSALPAAKARPSAPALRVMPEPKVAISTAWWAALYISIIGAAFIAVLFLNAMMARTAFSLQEAEHELGLEWDKGTSLIAEVERASSPKSLANKAEKLGLTPAAEVVPVTLDESLATVDTSGERNPR